MSSIPKPVLEQRKRPTASSVAVSEKPPAISVLIADSEEIYQVGLRLVLRRRSSRFVTEFVDSMRGLTRHLSKYHAHVLILDDALVLFPDHAIRSILRKRPKLKIIVLYSKPLNSRASWYYRAGVRAIVRRDIRDTDFAEIVIKVLQGQEYLCDEVKEWLLESMRDPLGLDSPKLSQNSLSQREVAIISGVVAGKRNKEIAFEIGASEQVVKNILARVYKKFGVKTKVELVTLLIGNKESREPAGSSTLPAILNLRELP